MRNFTDEEISFLVENGFLMPSISKYERNWYLYPGKPEKLKRETNGSLYLSSLPLGYPIVVEKEKLIKKDFVFPIELLTPYPFTLKEKPIELYVIPNGLTSIANFPSDNDELTAKLNEWKKFADCYISENTVMEEFSQTEMDLVKCFRDLYLIYIKLHINLITPTSKEFFKLYEQGQEYRNILASNFKSIHSTLESYKKFDQLMADIFEESKDIILLEEEILKHHGSLYWDGRNSVCGIEVNFAHLWYGIVQEKYKSNSYKEISPFLKKFRNKLYDNQEKRRSVADVKRIFSWMQLYDFSILKEDYLHFFNHSAKKDIIQFVEKKLKEHNALPKVSSALLIKEDVKTVYTNTLTINFNLIKEKIANHVLGAETLVALVTKAFREDEKECTFISSEIIINEGIVNFLIESLNATTTKELSEKLLTYLNSVISSGFLTVNMIKELIKHGNSLERRRYENDKKIMDEYLRINRPALLKNELGKELVTNQVKKKVNKL
jgi:hypothetical protein